MEYWQGKLSNSHSSLSTLSGKNKQGLPVLAIGEKGLSMQSNLVMIHPYNLNTMSDAQGQMSKKK